KVGEVMAVGSELIRLEVEGEGNEGKMSIARAPADPRSSAAPPAIAATSADAGKAADIDAAGTSARHTPARAGAEHHLAQGKQVAGREHAGPAGGSVSTVAAGPARPEGEKPLASPAVR